MTNQNSTRADMRHRFNLLSDALKWSLDGNKVLTAGQRICVNQERAALLRAIEMLSDGRKPLVRYTVPPHLEQKITFIAGKLKRPIN